ncbi:MAG: hypothetical protein IT373_35550 [Polyangiaceae bacterium]|nr:hypothetical protein [Polyangiaceae bacterium]
MAARTLSSLATKSACLVATAAGAAALAGCPLYPAEGEQGVPTQSNTQTHTTTSVTTTTSSQGGGGAGGEGAGGGGGGGGGAPASCLDPTLAADVFAIAEPGLCLVGKYTAPFEVSYALSPSWGRHGGPLTVQAGSPAGSVDLGRWSTPVEQVGELTAQTTNVPLAIQAPGSVFIGPTAVDLPFANWTLVSWTGDFGSSDGEALLLSGSSVAQRQPVAGLFSAVGVPSESVLGRILHTSLTKLGAAADPQKAGLYAADICANLQPCATEEVAIWGDANGPVKLDQDGNAFAVETTLSPAQLTLRAFAAASVAPGAGPTSGVELFTLDGFGSELAVLAPVAGAPGLVFFQPFDALAYDALDVVVERFIVSGGLVGAVGAPTPALTLATPGTPLTLMTDSAGRLWVAAVTAPGESTFYVLARSS